MNDRPDLPIEDLAPAYAVGALDEDERRVFEARLAESEDLQRAVADYQLVCQLVPMGGSVPAPDVALKARVVKRIAEETSPAPEFGSRRPRQWGVPLAWAAGLAGVAAGVVQWQRAGQLESDLATTRVELSATRLRLAAQDSTLQDLLSPGTITVRLVSTQQQPPDVRLYWNRVNNNVVLQALSLARAPAGQEYQLWFIPAEGAPLPASTFNPDQQGRSLITIAGPDAGVDVVAAAVTLEPEGGSLAPTGQILLVGQIAPG